MIAPDWRSPARVRAFVTTRDFGDLKDAAVREKLRPLLPADPAWLTQVHGARVIDLDAGGGRDGDAAFTRQQESVCAVQMADCLPVLFADEAGTTVAAAHAG
jgi:copper oxidase (laccase) domain-containing protein